MADAEIYGQGEQREVIHRGFELCPKLHIESAHGFRQGPIDDAARPRHVSGVGGNKGGEEEERYQQLRTAAHVVDRLGVDRSHRAENSPEQRLAGDRSARRAEPRTGVRR